MSQRNLLFLINPISGAGKKAGLERLIREKTEKAGFRYSIEYTRADGNYSGLAQQVTAEQITDVIICGGDGTVSTVTACLLGLPIAIGILPVGSGNGLALAAGIPYAPARALQVIFDGYSSYIDGFRINGKFCCMMCGVGNDAQIAHDFALQKKRGLKTYLRLSAISYFKSAPYPFTVELNGSKYDTDAFFIVIANSNQFGNYVTIAPRASLTDGLLDIVIVRKMPKLFLPFALLHQLSGSNRIIAEKKLTRHSGISYFQADRLILHNPRHAPVHIDGEPVLTELPELEFRIEPSAFRLLQPLPLVALPK